MVQAKRTVAWCGRVGVGRGETWEGEETCGKCEDEDRRASRLRPVQGPVCAGTFKYCGSQAPLRKELPWHRDSGAPFSPEPGVTLPAVDGERRSHRLDPAPGCTLPGPTRPPGQGILPIPLGTCLSSDAQHPHPPGPLQWHLKPQVSFSTQFPFPAALRLDLPFPSQSPGGVGTTSRTFSLLLPVPSSSRRLPLLPAAVTASL